VTFFDWLAVFSLAGASLIWAVDWGQGNTPARRALSWITLDVALIVLIIVWA
jgi:hypothetical protein